MRSPTSALRNNRLLFVLLAVTGLAACSKMETFVGAGARAYVGSGRCRPCHEEAFKSWMASHHDWAMKPATARTVLGDFSQTSFEELGRITRFTKRGDRYYVWADGPSGEYQEFEVLYTFGVDPLQQYLVDVGRGRLQCLTVAWDTRERRWFSLYPNERFEPGDPLYWTGQSQNWNGMCADCHSTNLQKGYIAAKDSFHTTWAEINVGCEACHGPGSWHVEWARTKRSRRPKDPTFALLVDYREKDHEYQIETCAPCHSRRHRIDLTDWSGKPYFDTFVPEYLHEGLYHPDGQILGEVYVYGSFVQSRMYQAGVRCTDCHNPHSLELIARGNDLCSQCHNPKGHPDFPSLQKKKYDTPEHHFHTPGKEGSGCIDCHMIERKYMVVDPRRDHSFRVPRPRLTLEHDTPNACDDCHAEKETEWSMGWWEKWWGPDTTATVTQVFARARAGDRRTVVELGEVATNVKLPGIVRASAAELLGRFGAVKSESFRDRDPMVRHAAAAALDAVSDRTLQRLAVPLLYDSLRAIRLEAARVLGAFPGGQLEAVIRKRRDRELEAYLALQLEHADFAASHLNLGAHYDRAGNSERAERFYLRALEIDPYFLPARFNLAILYSSQGLFEEGDRVLLEGIERVPDNGELYYSRGLLLAESGRLEEAAESFRLAGERLPGRARIHYNRGLALQHLGRRGDALGALETAYLTDRDDPDVVHALVVFHAQDEAWERAIPYARRLVNLLPGESEPRELLRRIESDRGASLRP